MKVTIGSDPEFIISYKGKPFSVIFKLGGSKKEPKDIGRECGIQEDNVNAELTFPPVNNVDDFVDYINYGKIVIKKLLKENTGLDCEVESWSSAEFSNEDLNNPVARRFGCEPSYCIYTGNVSPRPSPEEVGNIRSAGFHIHIGMPGTMSTKQKTFMIWCMDVMLGVPSLFIDTDVRRRKLYGNAGDFRYRYLADKDISVIEYRTLGAKLHETNDLIKWVYNQTMKAVEMFDKYKTFDKYEKEVSVEEKIIFQEPWEAIDNNNLEVASQILKITKTTIDEFIPGFVSVYQ